MNNIKKLTQHELETENIEENISQEGGNKKSEQHHPLPTDVDE